MKTSPSWQKFWNSPYREPLFLLLLCILTYGLLAPRLGFYLDDWYIVWFEKLFGARQFTVFFRNDRPLLAYVYMIFVPLFHTSRLGWQIFAVFSRWLAVCGFWAVLRSLLPQHRQMTLAAAILFMVYPGFQFHWFSVMYSQVYVLLAIYFLSYLLMIRALHAPRYSVFWVIAALLCQFIGIAPAEYFYGLELARPIVLFIVLFSQCHHTRKALKQTLLQWIPYLLVWLSFTAFRVGFGQSYGYSIQFFNSFHSAPLRTLLNFLGNLFWYLYNPTLQVWLDLPRLFQRNLLTSASIIMIVLILAGFGLILVNLEKTVCTAKPESHQAELVLTGTGIFLTLTAMIPFVFAGFPISLDFPYNRFLLALSPGIALFITGLTGLLLRTNRQQVILISLIASLAIGSQFLTARSFMLYWQQQTDFFAQLTWRIPGLKPGTTLITDDLGFSQYYSGTSLTAPLNLIYAPQNSSAQILYMLFLSSGEEASAIPAYTADQTISYAYRGFQFSGSTSDLVTFVQPSGACLRVLTPQDSTIEFSTAPHADFWAQAIPLSNLEDILSSPAEPAILPANLFGEISTDQWCYYFEKADLARQQQDWQQVIALYQQAQEKGFHPNSAAEWLPLIDAYARSGQLEAAFQTTSTLATEKTTDQPLLCDTWQNLARQTSDPSDQASIQKFTAGLGCQEKP
jgi:hypothetical protein